MSRLEALRTERSQRHSDVLKAWDRMAEMLVKAEPPTENPCDERSPQRRVRLAALAYSERWALFIAAEEAVAHELGKEWNHHDCRRA